MDKKNEVLELSFEFALGVIRYYELLEVGRKYVLAQQLLRCGTSIGANIREAQNAESAADFVHKLKIAAKEADETMYWLELCQHAENYPKPDHLLQKVNSIQRLLNTIIGTIKRKIKSD